MDGKSTRMIFATAALAAVAAVLAGPAGAYIQEGNGAQPVASSQQGLDVAIKTAIASRANEANQVVSGRPTGVHAALMNRDQSASAATLPHGAQVVLSPASGSQSPGLSGDSPLFRVSAPEPEGLTGDGALTRVPETAPAPTVSDGNDIDWTSYGAGAGMVALLAAGLVGILLTVRRRHTVGLP
jgi:hypothetical protein